MPEITFKGLAGRLEGRYHNVADPKAPTALILHPHPQFGGTMNNAVVYHMYYAFYAMGFTVLRFNFRGTGNSQGSFDNGNGELSDAASGLNWLQSNFPESRSCWIAGSSFGSWIAMHLLMRRPEIRRFVCAGLPTALYDFNFLTPCPCSGLIVNGENDSFAPYEGTEELVTKLRSKKGIDVKHVRVPETDHFFESNMRGFIKDIRQYIAGESGKADFEQPKKGRKSQANAVQIA